MEELEEPACVILLSICHVRAQYHFRYIIVDSAYGMRYYGIGSDSAIREQYRRDFIKMFHLQQWRDSLERMRPDRRHYYMYVSPITYTPRLLQKPEQLLVRCCFINPEELS